MGQTDRQTDRQISLIQITYQGKDTQYLYSTNLLDRSFDFSQSTGYHNFVTGANTDYEMLGEKSLGTHKTLVIDLIVSFLVYFNDT